MDEEIMLRFVRKFQYLLRHEAGGVLRVEEILKFMWKKNVIDRRMAIRFLVLEDYRKYMEKNDTTYKRFQDNVSARYNISRRTVRRICR